MQIPVSCLPETAGAEVFFITSVGVGFNSRTAWTVIPAHSVSLPGSHGPSHSCDVWITRPGVSFLLFPRASNTHCHLVALIAPCLPQGLSWILPSWLFLPKLGMAHGFILPLYHLHTPFLPLWGLQVSPSASALTRPNCRCLCLLSGPCRWFHLSCALWVSAWDCPSELSPLTKQGTKLAFHKD